MKAVVSEKGQVTIPKRLRDRLGIRAGQVLEFEEEQGRLVASKAASDDYRAVLDKWYGYLKPQYPGWTTDQLIEDMRGPILPGELDNIEEE
jgi:antitoxin PrlF